MKFPPQIYACIVQSLGTNTTSFPHKMLEEPNERIPVIPERPKKKSAEASSSEKIDLVDAPQASSSPTTIPTPVVPPRPKKGRDVTEDDVSIDENGFEGKDSVENDLPKRVVDDLPKVIGMDSTSPQPTKVGSVDETLKESGDAMEETFPESKNVPEFSIDSLARDPRESTGKETTPVIPPRPIKSKSPKTVELGIAKVETPTIEEVTAAKNLESDEVELENEAVASVKPIESVESVPEIPEIPRRPTKTVVGKEAADSKDVEVTENVEATESVEAINDEDFKGEDITEDVQSTDKPPTIEPKVIVAEKHVDEEEEGFGIGGIVSSNSGSETKDSSSENIPSAYSTEHLKEEMFLKKEPLETVISDDSKELTERKDQSLDEFETPIDPKRPLEEPSAAPSTAEASLITKASITAESSLTNNSSAESSPAESSHAENSPSAATGGTPFIPPRPKKPAVAGKVPPPKPNKLSSKIAAFQQMFNQPEPQIEQKRPAPLARKWSGEKSGIASNLQNIMARGIPLPGMAKPPGPISSPNSPTKEDSDIIEESAGESTQPAPLITRRAKGPRGKKLPKLVQETKIIVEPRFKVVSTDLWELQFVKAQDEGEEKELEEVKENEREIDDSDAEGELENNEDEAAEDANEFEDVEDGTFPKGSSKDSVVGLDEDVVDGEDDPDAGVEVKIDQGPGTKMSDSEEKLSETLNVAEDMKTSPSIQNPIESQLSDNILTESVTPATDLISESTENSQGTGKIENIEKSESEATNPLGEKLVSFEESNVAEPILKNSA